MARASSLYDKWGVLEIQPCHEPMDDMFYVLKIEPDAIRYFYDFLKPLYMTFFRSVLQALEPTPFEVPLQC